VCGDADNCPVVANADQADADGDGEGDACEHNILFVTSQAWRGYELGGLAGADAECQNAAEGAGWYGSYKAWLSDGSIAAADRLVHSMYPYVSTFGDPLASDWFDLTDGSLYWAPNTNEYGMTIWPDCAWTGTTGTGGSTPSTCGSWDNDAALGTVGNPTDAYFGRWSNWDSYPCIHECHLYCIQQ
jgi:hypothetical protein